MGFENVTNHGSSSRTAYWPIAPGVLRFGPWRLYLWRRNLMFMIITHFLLNLAIVLIALCHQPPRVHIGSSLRYSAGPIRRG
jgi:membrane protease YdiL (CAAX protease family)